MLLDKCFQLHTHIGNMDKHSQPCYTNAFRNIEKENCHNLHDQYTLEINIRKVEEEEEEEEEEEKKKIPIVGEYILYRLRSIGFDFICM